MRFRNSRLRTKVTALLMSLTALWVFAAWVTVREGINLLWVSTLDTGVAQPSERLVAELQNERRLTVGRLADPNMPTGNLKGQRSRTDEAVTAFKRLTRGSNVRRAADDTLERRLDQVYVRLDRLTAERQAIDSGRRDRYQTAAAYSDTITLFLRIFDSLATLDDHDFAKSTSVLLEVYEAREYFAQEDTLLVGALRSGRLSRTDLTRFVQLTGARRYFYTRSLSSLQHSDPIAYRELTTSKAIAHFQATEDTLILRAQPGSRPPITPSQWQPVAEPALAQLDKTVVDGGDRLVARARPITIGVVARLALAGGLGLLAVIASIVVSITTARALVRQLEKLRGAAWVLAEERLPQVVERLGHGEKVDVEAEAPKLQFGNDEIGQVGQAFNAVQETAIRVAVEQAELRRAIRDILLSLARRSQALIHRQLTLLDAMERREMDTKELEDLFRLDHLATRMRRNAENLIVLSGATPARGWRRAVPMMDVVRSAVAEVEDYTRVTVLPMDEIGLTGRAVGDIAHLLAELIENAVSFSPPYTTAQISGHMTASGYAVEIEDRGLGMSPENLAMINTRIAEPPEFNLANSAQLGLYVVGRLAERYGVGVSLKRSPYGGTTAVVLIPGDLLMPEGELEPRPEPPAELQAGTSPEAPDEAPADGVADVASYGPAGRWTAADGATATDGGSRPMTMAPARDGTAEPAASTAAPAPASAAPAAPAAPARATATETRARAATAPERTTARSGHATTPSGLPLRGEPRLAVVPDEAPDEAPAAGDSATSADTPTGSEPSVPEMTHTPSGLPLRVPQASLAPPLREDTSSTAATSADDDDRPRSPEELRSLLGGYQQGTRRGRAEAARSAGLPADYVPSCSDEDCSDQEQPTE